MKAICKSGRPGVKFTIHWKKSLLCSICTSTPKHILLTQRCPPPSLHPTPTTRTHPAEKGGKKEEKQLWNLFAIRHIFEAFRCRSNNQDFFSPLKSSLPPQAPLLERPRPPVGNDGLSQQSRGKRECGIIKQD